MTGTQSLVARAALGLAAAIAGMVLTNLRRVRTLSRAGFDRLVTIAFAVSRLAIFLLVFALLKIAPRGDVPAYYWPQAGSVLRGLVPYRDFVSSYAPLHPYADAVLIALWHTPLAMMLGAVLVEIAVLPVWLRAGREFLPEADLRGAALLYLASPISLQFVAIDGQDNVVIALLLGLAVLLALQSRVILAGALLGVSVAAVKFLPLLYVPAFLQALPRRWRFTAGLAAILLAIYGGFAVLLHAPILGAVAAEADLRSAGDLPYVLEAIFGIMLPARLTDGLLLLALLGIFSLVGSSVRDASLQDRVRVLTFGIAALTLALLVLSKKSWPPYLMLALFPVCLLIGNSGRWKLVAFSIFSVVAVGEHSFWASLLDQCSSSEFHNSLLAGAPRAVVMMAIELCLVGGYVWLLCIALARVTHRQDRINRRRPTPAKILE